MAVVDALNYIHTCTQNRSQNATDMRLRFSGINSNVKKKKEKKNGKRKAQGVPQSQTAALPRPQEEEETKQAQIEQTYEKH